MWKMFERRRGHIWHHNTAHALCMLGNKYYEHTLRIYNIYWFSKETIVARTHLNNMLYLNSLSCLKVHHHHYHYHHHHHHLANIELGHWLTRSGLTRLGVSLNVSPGLNVNVKNLPKIILFRHRSKYIILQFIVRTGKLAGSHRHNIW
jgi:hypothetical protein